MGSVSLLQSLGLLVLRPFADKLKRKITPAVRKRISKTKAKAAMVKKSKAGSVFLSLISKLHWGQAHVTHGSSISSLKLRSGGSYMKSSAAYPLKFGRVLCRAHLEFLDSLLQLLIF